MIRDDNNESKDLFNGYTKYYLAHSADENTRKACSSGGTVTQILIDLLASKEIDGAVGVGFTNNNAPYFEPILCKTREEIYACRGSKYYPVEFSGVLKQIYSSEGSYALVCLPCVATSIRRLQKEEKIFKNIKYILCLSCGHNKTAKYLDFIAACCGHKSKLITVSFRKKGDYPFSNFALEISDEDKTTLNRFRDGFISKLWCEYYFAQRGCVGCQDLFGIDGDVSFMDSWLDPYNQSHDGYNFVISKDSFPDKYLVNNPNLYIESISKQMVYESQSVIFKRKTDGIVPDDLLENMRFSEKLVDNEVSVEFIQQRLGIVEKSIHKNTIKTSVLNYIKKIMKATI